MRRICPQVKERYKSLSHPVFKFLMESSPARQIPSAFVFKCQLDKTFFANIRLSQCNVIFVSRSFADRIQSVLCSLFFSRSRGCLFDNGFCIVEKNFPLTEIDPRLCTFTPCLLNRTFYLQELLKQESAAGIVSQSRIES